MYTTRACPTDATLTGPSSSTFRAASNPAFRRALVPKTSVSLPFLHRIQVAEICSLPWDRPPGQLAYVENITAVNMPIHVIYRFFSETVRDPGGRREPVPEFDEEMATTRKF